MIDNFDSGIDNQESANEYACFRVAEKNDYTTKQAENCDNGNLDCKDCPWGGESRS